MSETIAACGNICRDFSWAGPLTEWLRNLAIVVGVVVAWRQLGSWRREKITTKRGELGEELVAVVSEIAGKISGIRSPFGYGPPEGEDDDGTYDCRRRLRELAEMDEEFQKLRQLKVRQKAFLGDEELEQAIEAFFDARAKLIVALRSRIRTILGGSKFGRPLTDKDIERTELQDAIIWENYGEDDPIKSQIQNALNKIEERMIPVIRLEIDK